MDVSPAVERIQTTVHQFAVNRGELAPTLCDWFEALLADDEGRPAEILATVSVSIEQSREFAVQHLPHQHAAPPTHQLLARSRELSVLLRADPTEIGRASCGKECA